MAKKATAARQKTSKPAVFVVRWRQEFYFYYDDTERIQPGNRYVKAFPTRKVAQAYIDSLHRGEVPPPRGANPFLSFRNAANSFSDSPPKLEKLTSFPEPVFLDWVHDLGLTPPPIEKIKRRYGKKPISLRNWDRWWEETAPAMSDEQRARIWKALDKLTFFEIVQTGLEE